MIIDTHAHLDSEEFEPDRPEVLARAQAANIQTIINPGIDLASSRAAIEIAQKYQNVYAAVGIQPEEIDKYFDEEEIGRTEPQGGERPAPDRIFGLGAGVKIDVRTELESLAKNKRVVAVGECGLDYKSIREKLKINNEALIKLEKEKQKDIFRRQLGTAILLDLPVIVHNREADEDIINEISRYRETKKLRGVFHCFTGSQELSKTILDLGFMISFTGIITYPNAKELRRIIKEIPLEKMLVETDAPLLAPQARRGERNEPAFVTEVIKTIAEIKNLTFEEIAQQTSQNAKRLFKI